MSRLLKSAKSLFINTPTGPIVEPRLAERLASLNAPEPEGKPDRAKEEPPPVPTVTKEEPTMPKKETKKKPAKKPTPAVTAKEEPKAPKTTLPPLTKSQLKILAALVEADRGITRGDLKELVGIGREGAYSSAWLAGLKDLAARKLIRIIANKNAPGFIHDSTPSGKKTLLRLRAKGEVA